MSSQKHEEVPAVAPIAPVAGITMEQLMEIVKAIKAPPDKTPEQLAAIENDKAMRRERAEAELARIERKHTDQLYCSHERTDGTFNVVYVYPSGAMYGFIYCNACEGIIRPEQDKPTDPRKLQDCQNHIFDTRLYNRLFRYAIKPKTDF